MQLPTLDITREEAREKLAEYEESLKTDRNAEDQAIAMGYRAAARGLPIIRLSEAVRLGGYHDNGLPRLAIGRADTRECFARWDGDDLMYSDIDDRWCNQGALVNDCSVRVRRPKDRPEPGRRRWRAGHTMVPLIPPRYRPRPSRMHSRHILWEVGEWDWVPPEDPALLRHIRGDLWAVLAVWDLTPLERHAMSQRRPA